MTTSLIGTSYLKMNGAGNVILILDLRENKKIITAKDAVAIGTREVYDQLMVLYPPSSSQTVAQILIYNGDGSLAQTCGNGMRCIAWYLMHNTSLQTVAVATQTTVFVLKKIQENRFCIDMGIPNFSWEAIPLSEPFADTRRIELQMGPLGDPLLHTPAVVNIGNPHAIFWIQADPQQYELERFGPLLENHPIFPEGANISLACVINEHLVHARVWERGAGITSACGSAACAIVAAGVRDKKLARETQVVFPGGTLIAHWKEDQHVWLEGDVELEKTGEIDSTFFLSSSR